MVNVNFIYALLIQCTGNYTQKMIIFTAFYYNAFPTHAQLLVDFVYTFRNFVNVYGLPAKKQNVAVYTCNRFTLNAHSISVHNERKSSFDFSSGGSKVKVNVCSNYEGIPHFVKLLFTCCNNI